MDHVRSQTHEYESNTSYAMLVAGWVPPSTATHTHCMDGSPLLLPAPPLRAAHRLCHASRNGFAAEIFQGHSVGP